MQHTIPKAYIARIKKRINECKKLTGVDVKHEVLFDLKSASTAGQAYYYNNSENQTHKLRLNPAYLLSNPDHFIHDTVAHEYAHLAAYQKYGTKINPHGKEWAKMMRAVGLKPNMYHTMEVTREAVATTGIQAKFICCNKCNHSAVVSPKMAKRIATGSTYHHGCGGIYMLAPVELPATVKPSKMQMCKQLYAANGHLSRSKMLELFINQAGCTPAGANTYYHTITNG